MTPEMIAWVNSVMSAITTDRVFSAIIAAIAVYAIFLARKATNSPERKFSFEDMLLNRDGTTSLSKVGQMVALVVSSWGFIYLTLDYKLTEWYFASYMIAWAGANAAKRWIDSKKAPDKEG